MKSDAERQTAYQARRKQAGDVRFGLWMSPDLLARIDAMRGTASRADWIRQTVEATLAAAAATSHPSGSPPGGGRRRKPQQVDLEDLIATKPTHAK